VHQIYGQRATLSVDYKPGDWESVRAWILKAGSGWHQAETAEDPQNMNKFAAGSLGAVIAHRIKWILSGRSAVEQMRQWQQALQAEQIIDAGPKRVSPLSAYQFTETKEGGMPEASFIGLLICLCIYEHACVHLCPSCNVGDTVWASFRWWNTDWRFNI